MGLDFLVIGAGKSGTTTLWAHLRSHPKIWMPPSKEVPFFSDDDRYDRGLPWLMTRFFAQAPEGSTVGKASPQYMAGKPGVPPQLIAARIASLLPQVKLIAVLRDPIERSISDYRMYARMGEETGSFEQVARELLDERALDAARWGDPEAKYYLAQGEYGRLLAPYLAFFRPDHVLVLFTEDLERDPARLLFKVFSFLEVDPDFTPPQLHRRLLRGGSRQRISTAEFDQLKKHMRESVWSLDRPPTDSDRDAFHRWLESEFPPAERIADDHLQQLYDYLDRRVWQPRRLRIRDREAFNWWFHSEWNVIPDEEPIEVSPSLRSLLEQHYRRDAELLTDLMGAAPPWLESWSQAEAVAGPVA